MDSKLKSLKVAQLKEILQKANVPVAAKATKDILIAKIIATPAAIEAYNSIHNPAENVEEPAADEVSVTVSEASPATLPTEPAPSPPEPKSAANAPAPVDEEAEKRKLRAARFGIPVIEPKVEEATKRKDRAKRFGTTTENTNGKKRPAPTETVDPEEAERRRKRAERFQIPVKSS